MIRSLTVVPLESVRHTHRYPMCVCSLRNGYESLAITPVARYALVSLIDSGLGPKQLELY